MRKTIVETGKYQYAQSAATALLMEHNKVSMGDANDRAYSAILRVNQLWHAANGGRSREACSMEITNKDSSIVIVTQQGYAGDNAWKVEYDDGKPEKGGDANGS